MLFPANPIYKYFHRNGDVANCRFCKKPLSCKKGSAKGLWTHLRAKHNEQYVKVKRKLDAMEVPKRFTQTVVGQKRVYNYMTTVKSWEELNEFRFKNSCRFIGHYKRRKNICNSIVIPCAWRITGKQCEFVLKALRPDLNTGIIHIYSFSRHNHPLQSEEKRLIHKFHRQPKELMPDANPPSTMRTLDDIEWTFLQTFPDYDKMHEFRHKNQCQCRSYDAVWQRVRYSCLRRRSKDLCKFKLLAMKTVTEAYHVYKHGEHSHAPSKPKKRQVANRKEKVGHQKQMEHEEEMEEGEEDDEEEEVEDQDVEENEEEEEEVEDEYSEFQSMDHEECSITTHEHEEAEGSMADDVHQQPEQPQTPKQQPQPQSRNQPNIVQQTPKEVLMETRKKILRSTMDLQLLEKQRQQPNESQQTPKKILKNTMGSQQQEHQQQQPNELPQTPKKILRSTLGSMPPETNPPSIWRTSDSLEWTFLQIFPDYDKMDEFRCENLCSSKLLDGNSWQIRYCCNRRFSTNRCKFQLLAMETKTAERRYHVYKHGEHQHGLPITPMNGQKTGNYQQQNVNRQVKMEDDEEEEDEGDEPVGPPEKVMTTGRGRGRPRKTRRNNGRSFAGQ